MLNSLVDVIHNVVTKMGHVSYNIRRVRLWVVGRIVGHELEEIKAALKRKKMHLIDISNESKDKEESHEIYLTADAKISMIDEVLGSINMRIRNYSMEY